MVGTIKTAFSRFPFCTWLRILTECYLNPSLWERDMTII